MVSSSSRTGWSFDACRIYKITYWVIQLRWRTRDINGDQFRQSKSSLSSTSLSTVPPRDLVGASRYVKHLPFQVFCCESGSHVVDPEQSYYAGIQYRAGTKYHNATLPDDPPVRKPDDECLDSTQAYFCRDLWVWKAKEGMKDVDDDATETTSRRQKRNPLPQRGEDADANAGSDYDASDLPTSDPPPASEQRLTAPNSVFLPARILVNPRCVTTYAGVSHTQLALDLFGPPDREEDEELKGQDVLPDWEGAPDTFVCQEQQYVLFYFSARLSSTLIVVFLGRRVDVVQRRISVGLGSRFIRSWRRLLDKHSRPS